MGIGDVRPPFLRTSSTRLLMPHWFQFFTGFGMSLPRTCAAASVQHPFLPCITLPAPAANSATEFGGEMAIEHEANQLTLGT